MITATISRNPVRIFLFYKNLEIFNGFITYSSIFLEKGKKGIANIKNTSIATART